MIFSKDEKDQKAIASITKGDRTEKYVCSFRACNNPACTCGTLTVDFTPEQSEGGFPGRSSSHTVEIDVDKKRLGAGSKKEPSKKDRAFAKLVFSRLDEDDFDFLARRHYEYKNKITESAGVEAVATEFDYADIEMNGTMIGYSDVLPYGDPINLSIDGVPCIGFDQYCLLPKCPCSHTVLSIMTLDPARKKQTELGTFEVDYRKRQWKTMDGMASDLTPEGAQKIVEKQVPDFYGLLPKRHRKLKAIYAHCKRRHFAAQAPPPGSAKVRVGRNDSCPCGSGKKYKKCCMGK